MKLRKLICLLLCILLCGSMAVTAYAAPNADASAYIQKMLNYYRYYQTDAAQEIDALLDTLDSVDARQGNAWRKIMATWSWVDNTMVPEYGVLPDGLPTDSSLGIVVMGYSLNGDGSAKQELIDRLLVALASAEKYPNAYIICTGGATARYSSATEAGVMARWLQDRGVSSSRIITESGSYSTTQNAQKTYRLLTNSYPHIRTLAVVTSDYHVYRSVLAFQAMSDYASSVNGTAAVNVVGSACNWTVHESREGLNLQAETLAMIADMELQYQARPALFSSNQGSSNTGSGSTNTGNSGYVSLWEDEIRTPATPENNGSFDSSSGSNTGSEEPFETVVVKKDGLWVYEETVTVQKPNGLWS